MSIQGEDLGPFLKVMRDLAADLEGEALYPSLVRGLMSTGLDRCVVVAGTDYEGDTPTTGEIVAVDDAEPALPSEERRARYTSAKYPTFHESIRQHTTFWSNDVPADERLAEAEQALLSKLEIQSVVVCPMIYRDWAVGYLLAGKRGKNGFSESASVLIQLVVDRAAIALEMAHMTVSMREEAEAQAHKVSMFKSLVENAVDACCIATLQDHKLVYANPAYYEMHGYSMDDQVLGQVDESFAVYDGDNLPTTTTQITRTGGIRREHAHTRKDGSTFEATDTVFAVLGRDGKAVALGSIIRDIVRQESESQRTHRLSDMVAWRLEVITAISQEISSAPAIEELFERVVNLVKERFNYYHCHLYLARDNEHLELVEGYGEPGRMMKARGHHVPVGQGLIGAAAETGKSILVPDVSLDPEWTSNPLLPHTRSELAVPIKLGEEVLGVLDVQSAQLYGLTEDDDTLLVGLCGQIAVAIQNARMVSNIQQLVEERTREVAIFQSLAENATYGVLMASPDGQVSYANQANHHMFGYGFGERDQDREMNGLSLSCLFPPSVTRQFTEQMPELLAGRPWQADVQGVRKDGSTFDLLMLAFAIVDTEGQPLAVVCMNQDVTEQKQLEAERQRLNQEIIAANERLISELSAPLIPITENILVLPLIGAIDSRRAQQIMESLLEGIEKHDAEAVIIDVTGVPLMDTSVANHLIQMTDAAGLVGAKMILVGITPKVAQTIVELGVDLSGITTRSNLQGGVEYALRLQERTITSIG